MMWLIPIISGLSYALGGDGRIPYLFIPGANAKLWRWLMGIPIAIIGVLHLHFWAILAIPAYLIATNVFVYGENSWLNFLGEWGKFFVAGFVLGSCSFILLPFGLALSQSILSGISFLVIKYFDDKGVIGNPFVEFLRGLSGTILLIFA